jgi:predicted Zn-dependent protease
VNPAAIASFEHLLAAGRDEALLRFSPGNEYPKIAVPTIAIKHLESAIPLDAGFSAPWKLLGRAFAECGRFDEALTAYEHGIETTERKGDMQATKEMTVFTHCIVKQHGQFT